MRLFTATAAGLLLWAHPLVAHPGPGIVVDRSGRVYFVKGGDNRIYTISPDGEFGIFVDDARLRLPHHLVLDSAGMLYAASDFDGRIWRIDRDGRLELFFSTPGAILYGRLAEHDSLARGAVPHQRQIHIAAGGDPWILDDDGHVYGLFRPFGYQRPPSIVRITRDTAVTRFAVSEPARPFGNLHASAMAWAPDGSLWLTDDSRLWRIGLEGTRELIDMGEANPMLLRGIAVDAAGRVFVADYGENRVLVRAASGAWSVPAATESLRLHAPVGLAIGPTGDLFIVDQPPGSTIIWRVGVDSISELYADRSFMWFYGFALMVAGFQALLILHTAMRQPRHPIDWAWWTVAIGALVLVVWWAGRDQPLYAWLRHLVALGLIVAAWRSWRRMEIKTLSA